MFKRASNALAKFHRIAESPLLKQQTLSLALRNTQKYPSFSSFPKYNSRTMTIHSFSRHSFASLPAHEKLSMPALSPTMEAGNIGKWNVKVGDQVLPGDQLCEIETDKATLAFEVHDEGYVAAILVPDGTKGVQVGTPIVIIVEKEADVKAFSNYKEGAAQEKAQKPAETQPQETQKPAVTKPAANLPPYSKVTMPSLSPTMETGKILQWIKKEGDKVEAGEVIASVETDKATIDFVYQDDGYIAKILVPEGAGNVNVGQLVAIVVDNLKEVKAFADYSGDSSATSPKQAATQQQVTQTERNASATQTKAQTGERVFASPFAKKTAGEQNVNLSEVEGSGPHGRVLKHNVDEFVAKGGAQAKPEVVVEVKPTKAAKKPEAGQVAEGHSEYTDIPLTTIREVIAKRLLQSKTTIPHYYVETEILMDEATKIRTILNESATTKISFNDLFIKAASLACIDVPEVNSQWHGTYIRKFKNADISVAVDTGSGLITPIVFSANSKGLNEISTTIKELADRAKKNALKPHEFQGGTFSISNLGMFGVTSFSAVINPPQSAILAVGKTDKKVVAAGDGAFKTVSVMYVTLSCDHRVIDGAVAARWLEKFKGYLEKPHTMLL